MSFLTALIFVIGLFPLYAVLLLSKVISQFLPSNFIFDFYNLIPLFNTLTYAFIVLAGLMGFFWLIRSLLLRGRQVAVSSTQAVLLHSLSCIWLENWFLKKLKL
jgi:hypothetical protein